MRGAVALQAETTEWGQKKPIRVEQLPAKSGRRKNPCMANVASRSLLHELSNTPQGSSKPFIHDRHR